MNKHTCLKCGSKDFNLFNSYRLSDIWQRSELFASCCECRTIFMVIKKEDGFYLASKGEKFADDY